MIIWNQGLDVKVQTLLSDLEEKLGTFVRKNEISRSNKNVTEDNFMGKLTSNSSLVIICRNFIFRYIITRCISI